MHDVRYLYRYARTEVDKGDGVVVTDHIRESSPIFLSFRPQEHSSTQTEQGITDANTWRVYVNGYKSFVQGDRIGTWESKDFEVTTVRTNLTGQVLTVAEIQPEEDERWPSAST